VAQTTTKLDKRDLKTPDEFMTWGSKATAYVAENAVMVIGGTIVVLLLIAGGFGWMHQQKQREIEAAGKLFEAEKILTGDGNSMFGMVLPGTVKDEDKRKAIEILDKVSSEYDGLAAARRARLKKGDLHLELGEYDAAIAAYEKALPGAGSEEIFYAQNGIGRANESKQAWDQAAAAYRKVAEDELGVMRDLATLDLARVLIKTDKKDEARALLSAFPEKFKDSSLKTDAEKELAKVGGPLATPTPAAEDGASDGDGDVPADGDAAPGSGSAG
jgi:tetratricopeptide (TPR) repeat protein